MSISVFNGHRRIPPPVNEPNRTYAPGTPERASLKARLKTMASEKIVMPHDHRHVLGEYHKASEEHVRSAVDAALAARNEWASWSFDDRAAVILKAAEL